MATSPFNYNKPTPAGDNKFNFQPPSRTPTDIVTLGTFTFPGISKVEINRARKAKIQTKKKGKGDRLVDSGLELATVKITTRLFTDQDYSDMERIIDFFEHKVGLGTSQTANSFAIIHPDTRIRRVFNVFVESIDGPFHYMPPAYSEFTFHCREVIKQKDQTPKTQKESTQKPIETTTPIRADVGGNLPPSQDSSVVNPKRKRN